MNRTLLFLSTLLLTVISAQTAYCQYSTSGSDPGRARWRTISSDHYRLIYPEETDSIARVYLRTLERVRPAVMSELNIDPKPIPVILHPYTTLSNGVVTWAPKRIDLFSSPDPYGSEPDSWITHLTIHESRHVGQVEHFTKGFYNVFRYILGEQVTGLGLGLFISTYTLEGDAVIAETELTRGGRGRNADFLKYIRAMYLNGDYRNWDRLRFGSYRYHTPNDYVFGYLLGGYMRYESSLADFTGRYMSTPVDGWYHIGKLLSPTSYITGVDEQTYLERSQKTLTEMWRQDYLSRGEFTGYSVLTSKKDRLYTEFSNPIFISDRESPYYGSVIAVKSGMETACKLVMIDSSGREHFLRFFNTVASRPTYDSGHMVYWSETVTNNSADLEDFSVIMSFDILTGRTRSLQHRAKYFNPAPSPSGDTLAVAEYAVDGRQYLTLLSARTGEPFLRIDPPENGQPRESAFIGGSLFSTVITEDGIGIYRLRDGKWSETVRPQPQSISGLKAAGDILYFSSDLDGVLNIYCLDTRNGSLYRLTNSEYGADFPYYDPETRQLFYCEYGLGGYRLVCSGHDRLQRKPADFKEAYRHPLAEFLSAQASLRLDSLAVDTADICTFDCETYPSRPYNKLLHAFRIHSWFPAYVDVDRIMSLSFEHISQIASPGVTVLSQNSLGDIISTLSYGYVRDWNTGGWFHSGHFTLDARLVGNLAAEVRVDVNERNTFTYAYDLTTGTQFAAENRHSPLLSVSAMLYYPISFNSRGWYRSLTPFAAWNFTNDRHYAFVRDMSANGIITTQGVPVMRHQLSYGIAYGQVIPTAGSQIFPRWGFGITVRGASSPGGKGYFKDLVYADGYAYLPGITRQQGLKISLASQIQLGRDRLMTTSMAALPRGYNRYSFADTYLNITADYAVPVYLGDFRIGPILYFKRLQLIPFADYGIDFGESGPEADYFSYGADMMVDFHIIRLNFPISAGVRYARTGPNGTASRNYFGFLFDISF
ncbi:MAG TPA: hypothetical protein IAC03_00550 [Candidatus Coprenecus pullistercoris]|nr:hypothetical protein [Candidatus Coprenecus pullistercoris]